jgi:hypothetical protein
MKLLRCLIILSFISCTVKQEELSPVFLSESLPAANTSLEAVRSRVLQSENGFDLFSTEEDSLWLHAYVISSDEGGNFYKELYVQDQPKSPTVGARILLDRTALSDVFLPGRKVAILLNGLGAGFKSNVLTIGEYQGNDIGEVAQFLIDAHCQLTDSLHLMIPKEVHLASLKDEDIGQWVQINEVQFALDAVGKTFSGEAFDEFDGERRLTQCSDQRSILMSTSTFADYKSIVLPDSAGTICGVLTRDFFGEKNILKINDPTNIEFKQLRCDPFFEENFEAVPLGLFEKQGWVNFNQAGTQFWEVYEDENSLGQSIALGSYRSGDKETISWLITPELVVSSLENSFLAFRTSTSFADNSSLSVLVSTNWTGDTASLGQDNWRELDVRIAENTDNNTLWIDSGDIPIDFGPKFHLAFRYTGSGKTASDGTYEIDDIRIFTKQ